MTLTTMSHVLPRPRANHPFLRRGTHTLQVGLERHTAAVLNGMTDAAIRALVRLDGSLPRGQLISALPELDDVLIALEKLGLIEDSPRPDSPLSHNRRERLEHDRQVLASELRSGAAADDVLAQRMRRVVAIRGLDKTAAHVAVGLANAGIGTVAVLGHDRLVSMCDITPVGPFEPHVSWIEQISEAVRRQGAHSSLVDAQHVDLVVIAQSADVQPPWTDPELAHDLMADDVPHYPVAVSGSFSRIGPVIIPGSTPCLDCLDLRETDRDRAWPALVDQVRLRHPNSRAQDSALATLSSAVAVREIVEFLDRKDEDQSTEKVHGYNEFRASDVGPTFVPLARHPLCGCG